MIWPIAFGIVLGVVILKLLQFLVSIINWPVVAKAIITVARTVEFAIESMVIVVVVPFGCIWATSYFNSVRPLYILFPAGFTVPILWWYYRVHRRQTKAMINAHVAKEVERMMEYLRRTK